MLYDRHIVGGVSENSFEPDSHITRAQCAKIIALACGFDADEKIENVFSDVSPDTWYAPFVNASYSAGVINGYEDNTFRPDSKITRQELAKMLCVAGDILNIAPRDEETVYSDNEEIAQWAEEYVKKASMLGLFGGDESNRFNPTDNATRAETAAVICRLISMDLEGGDEND